MLWEIADRQGEVDAEDGDEPARRMFARGYTVFISAPVDGYTPPKMRDPGVSRVPVGLGPSAKQAR